jgi:thioesterase domain-containing protein/acyl carrier protein
MALAAYDHAEVPLHSLSDHPELVQIPFTRAVFALQDGSGFTLTLDGLHVEQLPVYNNTANFDLFLTVQARSDGLRLIAEYRTSLFEPGTIQNLLDDYAALLDAALADAGCPLADLLPSPRTFMKTHAERVPDQLYQAPRTPLEAHLVTLWEEVFDRRPIGIYDNFFDIGGHSLMALRLFARIEKEVGASLPLSTLFGETTIAHLAQLVETEATGSSWDILVPIQPLGSKPPFFSIHGVEGGVLGYRDMALVLGEDQPVWGIQAKGLDGRDTHDSTIEEMATRYIDVMRSRQPNGPYRIGGYCLGGVIAYEMARQLEKTGEEVSVLAVFEGSLPDTGDVRMSLLERLRMIWNTLPAWIRDYSGMSPHQLMNRVHSTYRRIWSKIRRNPDIERRMRVEETLDIDVDNLPSQHIEITDALMNAAIQYTPGEYKGQLTLFRARNRSVNEVLFGSLDPKMGWGRLAKGGVQVRLVEGYHRNMHLAPYASSLAAELKKCLDGAAAQE